MTKIKHWLAKLPSPVRAALTTAVVVFTTLFVPAALGWARAFLDAVTTHQAVPKISVLVSALVSAALAALSGLVNFSYRYAQSKGWLGLNALAGPVYDLNTQHKLQIPDNRPEPEPVKPWQPTAGPTGEQLEQLIDWADDPDVVRGETPGE